MPGDSAHRGGQAAAPTVDSVWAPPGSAAVAPAMAPPHPSAPPANGYQQAPLPPAPVAPPSPPQARRRWGVWVISGAAVLLGVSAVVMSVITATRPTPPPVTTTITAAAPTYSAGEIAAAKKEACEASARTTAPINQAQQGFHGDCRRSQLTRVPGGSRVGRQYLRSRLSTCATTFRLRHRKISLRDK